MQKIAKNFVFLIALGVLLFMAAGALGFAPATSVHPEEREQIQESLASGKALFVDVRTPAEYAQNGLPGSVNIPLHELTFRISEFGNPEDSILLYCRTGNRSSQAQRILEQYGFQEVQDLGGHRSAQQFISEIQR